MKRLFLFGSCILFAVLGAKSDELNKFNYNLSNIAISLFDKVPSKEVAANLYKDYAYQFDEAEQVSEFMLPEDEFSTCYIHWPSSKNGIKDRIIELRTIYFGQISKEEFRKYVIAAYIDKGWNIAVDGDEYFGKKKAGDHTYNIFLSVHESPLANYLCFIRALFTRKTELQRIDFGNGYYLGQVINGKKEGIGAYFFNDGSKFEGEFKNNTINGSGIYFWPSGRYFAGTWIEGKRNGYGIEVREDGTYAIQYWENEVSTRFPRPVNPQRYNTSAGYYIGDLKDGKPHGRGTFYWNDGNSFEGTWVNNIIRGSGLLRFANGDVMVGYWTNGTILGCYGLRCSSNGQKWIGYWENDVYKTKSFIIFNQ